MFDLWIPRGRRRDLGAHSRPAAEVSICTFPTETQLEERMLLSTINLSTRDNQLLVNGQPQRLIFYGTYGMLDRTFNSNTFLDSVNGKVNAVRIWVNFHWANDLSPFAKSGGTSKPSYNLLKFDQTYFDRLRNFVQAADQRGIAVQVCLFDAVMLEDKTNRWSWSPYNDDRNGPNIPFLKTKTRFDEFFSTKNELWSKVNKELIKKVVGTLGNEGNVIYEIMNEPHVIDGYRDTNAQKRITAFHESVATVLKAELAPKAGSKLVSVNCGTSGPLYDWVIGKGKDKVDIVSLHINSESGTRALKGFKKPVIISNDGDASCIAGGSYSGKTRAGRTEALLKGAFSSETATGTRHFEFLDLGLYGKTHGNGSQTSPPNYDPDASKVDWAVVNTLSRYR